VVLSGEAYPFRRDGPIIVRAEQTPSASFQTGMPGVENKAKSMLIYLGGSRDYSLEIFKKSRI
jgi:hypothetical protein